MKPKDWSLVAGVFLALELIRNEQQGHESVEMGVGVIEDPIDVADVKRMNAIYDLSAEALTMLYRYGNTPPPPSKLDLP